MRSRRGAEAQSESKESKPPVKTAVTKSRKSDVPKEITKEAKKTRSKATEKLKESNASLKSTTSQKNSDKIVINGPYDDLQTTIKDAGWRDLLQPILESEDFRTIINFLNQEHAAGKEIFPPKELIFSSLNLTPLDQVKAVIIGQDPYHDGSAHGLAFSVPREQTKLPSSLRTMYKELTEDPEITFATPDHGYLARWAEQGVLMLNAVLTVEAHKANSHSRCGWSKFTDQLLQRLTEKREDLVFILWGNFAQKKKLQCQGKQIFIEGTHPSGLTCGKFYGCRHFSAVNKALVEAKREPINWNLE